MIRRRPRSTLDRASAASDVYKRQATQTRLKTGLKTNGEITAVDAEVVQRGGAYAGYGLVTILYAGALLHALYRVGAVRYRGYRVYTNLPPCGAMRGHGAVNVRFAFESLLDEMAGQLLSLIHI